MWAPRTVRTSRIACLCTTASSNFVTKLPVLVFTSRMQASFKCRYRQTGWHRIFLKLRRLRCQLKFAQSAKTRKIMGTITSRMASRFRGARSATGMRRRLGRNGTLTVSDPIVRIGPRKEGRRGCRHFRQRELSNRCKKYGKTAEWYRDKYAAQEGLCAICKQPETQVHHEYGTIMTLAIDHNHQSGQARGLLCSQCNRTLTRCESIPNWMESAANYLAQF